MYGRRLVCLRCVRSRPTAPTSARFEWCAAVGSCSCQRSMRFDGSRSPWRLFCSLPRLMRCCGSSLGALVRIPVRHAAFVAASMNQTERRDPLCSVPTTRWLAARLRPTRAVRMVRANARVSARIGHRALPQWRVSRCVRSRSPTSRRNGAICRDDSCTFGTPRPPPPSALAAHGAHERPM